MNIEVTFHWQSISGQVTIYKIKAMNLPLQLRIVKYFQYFNFVELGVIRNGYKHHGPGSWR